MPKCVYKISSDAKAKGFLFIRLEDEGADDWEVWDIRGGNS